MIVYKQCNLLAIEGWLPVQAIIGNYAVPILEDKQVWGTSDETRTAYLDSQDVARMALAALRCDFTRRPNRVQNAFRC